MKDTNLYFGDTLISSNEAIVSFETIQIKKDTFFKIENYNEMNPFFMTIVSDVDFWLFISSTGGLTAGRKTPETALFPYYTDDKIHDSNETTGSHTVLIVSDGKRNYLWKPFSNHNFNVYKITRNLYKNSIGNKIMFEEINHDLNLTFRYTWKTSQKYGLVKASELINDSKSKLSTRLLDGIRNILPYGVDTLQQSTRSTLVDGYKRSELIADHGLGIFTLSSIISDKAEPSESLKSTTVWSKGLDHPVYLLSEQQISAFEKNKNIVTEQEVKGRRGAFYVSSTVDLEGHESKEWWIVSELNQSAAKIESLIRGIDDGDTILANLESDILKGDENLKKLVFEADGFQMTKNANTIYRHFSNTLYNIMRGGIYASGYEIDMKDLKQFIENWNKEVFSKHSEYLERLPEAVNYFELLRLVEMRKDLELERLVREYLPLTYSRRHGDPSRPWNKFNIEVTKENGEKNLNFEGNWRDIFQNWEALSLSYPGYIESIISKFVNASTADGYNPYRITKEGVDWEKLDSMDPWSNIGYWGDHQVIYLLKLMEQSKKYKPNELSSLLYKNIFVYANVPYRIKGLDDLLKDPKNTIIFDGVSDKSIEEKVAEIGADGKLVFVDNEIYHVNLMEKLLTVLLSKLSNFIPCGGIWMNTQRPEWNDANNALVGNGVSMVTLYYLYRYLGFVADLMEDLREELLVSVEVRALFIGIFEVLKENAKHLGSAISDEVRFDIVSRLGRHGETYRQSIYTDGFSGEKEGLSIEALKDFVNLTMSHIKDTIDKNKRVDGLYHSYNLVKFGKNTCSISNLYEMLEGQVAVLSSKALDSKEALSVLKALRESAIYREDQNSFMLYPVRELPKFMSKNIIPEDLVSTSHVMKIELDKGLTRFVEKDVKGQYHFNGQFRNGNEIMDALKKTNEYNEEDILAVGEIFANIFDHHSFTGRSGTFYKYEGLGCIYWHMVSKLVLAAEENYYAAITQDEQSQDAEKLAEYFHELKAGIGVEKSPVDYGAFPTDAYSHTPSFAGVQQPGMTGQVKEDIISRFGELGVNISNGEICFNPRLLSKDEMLDHKTEWKLPSGTIILDEKQLGFTICSVPIIYELNNYNAITICYHNGDKYTFENIVKLNKQISQSIFNRDGEIAKIIVRTKL
ncbi:MAG: hypothetical protein IBX70_08615 [Clostridia bacterium]|nr:hypothetical protein [Clostridia bacterium]